MNIDLPVFSEDCLKIVISEKAYNAVRDDANQHLMKACKIYDAYLKNKDSVLYEIFYDELQAITTNMHIIAQCCPDWASNQCELLWRDAELVEHDGRTVYQATMLMELGNIIFGDNV